MGTSCHSKDTGIFPQVPVQTTVSPAHGPLSVNMTHEFSEPGRTNHTLDSALTGIQLYFWKPARLKAQQHRCSFKTVMPRGCKTSASYCSCTRNRLGSGGAANRTAKWPRHRAYSRGSRNWMTIGVERHRWLQSYVQKLLGSVEIAHCEKRHTRVQLGICQWMISNSSNSCSSEQSEGYADWTTRWIIRRSLGYQQNPE
jgi:hypothetical protein